MKKLLFLLLLIPALCYASNPYPNLAPDLNAKTWHWRWAYQDKDTWWKYTAYWPGKEVHTSWFDHGVFSFMLYDYYFFNRGWSPNKAMIGVVISGTFWEGKDALLPWEIWGKLGGEGFSGQDLVRNFAGASLARVFNAVTHKKNRNLLFGANVDRNNVSFRLAGRF